jgi:hypothetical protein
MNLCAGWGWLLCRPKMGTAWSPCLQAHTADQITSTHRSPEHKTLHPEGLGPLVRSSGRRPRSAASTSEQTILCKGWGRLY